MSGRKTEIIARLSRSAKLGSRASKAENIKCQTVLRVRRLTKTLVEMLGTSSKLVAMRNGTITNVAQCLTQALLVYCELKILKIHL
ncbi:hypothetical protein AC249_AIPGENE24311 [Exaiptasia diaphana]|nr:hypothetical protein AC249_AIPGENE24311 [Exaiptasia diaphana]